MSLKIKKAKALNKNADLIFVYDKVSQLSKLSLSKDNLAFAKKQFDLSAKAYYIYDNGRIIIPVLVTKAESNDHNAENIRIIGYNVSNICSKLKLKSVQLQSVCSIKKGDYYLAEGISLSNYQFLKYRQDKKELQNSLQSISICESILTTTDVQQLNNLTTAVYKSRDLVNEPLMYLTAPRLASEIRKMGKEAGFKVTVFGKKKIQGLKMGGVLSVNLGSIDPPSFSVLEYKHPKAVNKQPIVLVGKGVVYDTGGLSLKPTKDSMDHMKCDMGGAAAVAGSFYAVAKSKLPLNMIGLVPATDNRPGGNAYVPGDVITMYSGKTVEVLNTDAEGRMLLADALAYAKKYKPELVIDLATLTGSAVAAIGNQGIVCMGTADEKTKNKLKQSGHAVYERLVELPLWKEYRNLLNSDIADIKNVGGRLAGAITAGKFLEFFTDYPWIHLDIAPTAWSHENRAYITKNGTGSGVRLLFDFLKNRCGK